jgi:epoxide hydrolase
MTDSIRSHPFTFPDAALDDLRERLGRTRWPDCETVTDWSQGAPLARMHTLCEYWRKDYD